jgi:truncated hemoglobin YjbI
MKFDRTTDESIAFLVHAFYEKVRRDPQLKPIFNQAIGGEWAAHMAKMADFWSAAMRISRSHTGGDGGSRPTHRGATHLKPVQHGSTKPNLPLRWLCPPPSAPFNPI